MGSTCFNIPRVGSGRVGSGRVGSGRVGSGRVGSGRVKSSLKISWVGLGHEVSNSRGSGLVGSKEVLNLVGRGGSRQEVSKPRGSSLVSRPARYRSLVGATMTRGLFLGHPRGELADLACGSAFFKLAASCLPEGHCCVADPRVQNMIQSLPLPARKHLSCRCFDPMCHLSV